MKIHLLLNQKKFNLQDYQLNHIKGMYLNHQEWKLKRVHYLFHNLHHLIYNYPFKKNILMKKQTKNQLISLIHI
jgi:hypothetical protein